MILLNKTFDLTTVVQSNDIINVLENQESMRFIDSHLDKHGPSLMLKYHGKISFDLITCVNLIQIYKKAKAKLPTFRDKRLAIDDRSYQQSTSEEIAMYKRNVLKGKSLLDITAGIGVDSTFLASNFEKVVAVERNENLHQLAIYNLQKLGIENVKRICGNGLDWLKDKYDWIYLDPDRRVSDKRVISLSDMEPNLLQLAPRLIHYARKVYIKLSPLFDIAVIWRDLQYVSNVYILAERGEIKEVGVVLSYMEQEKPIVHLVDVSNSFYKEVDYLSIHKDRPPTNTRGTTSDMQYLWLPSSLYLKARLSFHFLKGVPVTKHPEFEIYYSNKKEIKGFRGFRIIRTSKLNVKSVKRLLSEEGISQVNIIVKGSSQEPKQWFRKLKIKAGGDKYLFLLHARENEAILSELSFSQ